MLAWSPTITWPICLDPKYRSALPSHHYLFLQFNHEIAFETRLSFPSISTLFQLIIATFILSFSFVLSDIYICMQSESGSRLYPARDAPVSLTRGFLLGHRNKQQLPSSRRKRSTVDSDLFLTDQDENKLIQSHTTHRPLLASKPRKTGGLDSSALRVKVRQFSVTARSVAGACTASPLAFLPACCTNNKSPKSRGFRPLRIHSTNHASPFPDKPGKEKASPSSLASETNTRIKLPAVRSGKAKGSDTLNNYSDIPSLASDPSTSHLSPTVFDVDRANLTPGPSTKTHRDRLDSFFDSSSSSSFEFPSFDALDDLTRWGVDAMTFLSTSSNNSATNPSNVAQTSPTNSNPGYTDTSFSNPFSTPFGDDDLLENEIPFPSTRPRVVLEPMGIKKSKTLATDKARNLTSSSGPRSRYLNPFNHPFPTTPVPIAENSSSTSTPPVLPHPLPILQTDESPSPLSDDSLARTSSYLQNFGDSAQPSTPSESDTSNPSHSPYPSSSVISGVNSLPAPKSSSDTDSGDSKPSIGAHIRRKLTPLFAPLTRKDADDQERLGPDDCKLSVMFPQTSHYEVWDMSDHGWVSIPALLCLMIKDPRRWAATPLAMPDVGLIELKCDDVPLPVRFASLRPEREALPPNSPSSRSQSPSVSCRPNTYSTTFLGGKSAIDESSFHKNGVRKGGMSMIDAMRKHEEEQKIGKDKISLEGKWTRTLGLPGVGGTDNKRKRNGSTVPHTEGPNAASARGWYLKFWIPIPTRLFLKRETRVFEIHAQIWMVDQRVEHNKPDRFETEIALAHEKEDDGSPSLEATTEMTVSHLRKERDMDAWW